MESSGYTISFPAQAPDLKEPNVKITELPPTPPSPNKSIPLRSITLQDPTLITTEFDAHRFQAAAYTQLINTAIPKLTTQAPAPITLPGSIPSDTLITSPYNKLGHYLSLSTPPLPLSLPPPRRSPNVPPTHSPHLRHSSPTPPRSTSTSYLTFYAHSLKVKV
ncbi:hypothetical protein J3E73DRAFT_376844 [Bipolaris maydis]|nr:hypothetical protein J3E73DRAFT_376844 [Bipolaris maydis]